MLKVFFILSSARETKTFQIYSAKAIERLLMQCPSLNINFMRTRVFGPNYRACLTNKMKLRMSKQQSVQISYNFGIDLSQDGRNAGPKFQRQKL